MLIRRRLLRAQNAPCGNDRSLVWIVRESDLEGGSSHRRWALGHRIPRPSHRSLIHSCSRRVVSSSHRQKTRVYDWLGKIPQRIFRTRSGDGGGKGTGESFQGRTLGHTPSEYSVFTDNTGNGHRGRDSAELSWPTGVILPRDLWWFAKSLGFPLLMTPPKVIRDSADKDSCHLLRGFLVVVLQNLKYYRNPLILLTYRYLEYSSSAWGLRLV